jgi:hypothetical protein
MKAHWRTRFAALATVGFGLTVVAPARADLLERLVTISSAGAKCDCSASVCTPEKGMAHIQHAEGKKHGPVQRDCGKSVRQHTQVSFAPNSHLYDSWEACPVSTNVWDGFEKSCPADAGAVQHSKAGKKAAGMAWPHLSLPKLALPECGLISKFKKHGSKGKSDVVSADKPAPVDAPDYHAPFVEPPEAPPAYPAPRNLQPYGDPVPVPPDPDATA